MINFHIDTMLLDLLEVSEHVTDLNLSVGRRPQVEIDGDLQEIDAAGITEPLTPLQIEIIAMNLMAGERRLVEKLVRTGTVDLSYSIPGRTRLRVNIFRQRGTLGASLRVLADRAPDLDDLGLPSAVGEAAKLRRGLVLVIGPAGSGKSTTLAALVERINATRSCHIVCIEDPIEYLFQHKQATVNQREVGTDTPNLHQALEAAMRQGAKVILMTELRDLESLKIALWAAETGHLVLAAMPAEDIATALSQLAAGFPEHQQRRLWARFSQAVQLMVQQRLVAKIGGGFMAVAEVVESSDHTRQALAHHGLHDTEPIGRKPGVDFDRRLQEAVMQGTISRETALINAVDSDAMGRDLDGGDGNDSV